MTSALRDHLRRTVDILTAETHSLRELAELSGYDPLTFYRGADLRGLDLSHQDLRGLNFEGADFRGTNLGGAVIDAGALNGSRVNRENKHLQDPFDCYLSDIHDANVWRSRLYARCRRNSIQTAIRALEIPDEEIERVLWGKGSTAWRLYDSKPVRIEEMSAVATYLSGRLQMIEDNHPVRQMAAFNQPVVEVLRRGKGRKVDHISRKELYEIIDEIASALQASNLAAMATAVGHALRSVYYLGSRDIRPFKDLISKLDEIS